MPEIAVPCFQARQNARPVTAMEPAICQTSISKVLEAISISLHSQNSRLVGEQTKVKVVEAAVASKFVFFKK